VDPYARRRSFEQIADPFPVVRHPGRRERRERITGSSGVTFRGLGLLWLSQIFGRESVGSASSLGQVQAPIPLRAYPAAPALPTQSATPSHPGDPELARAKGWDDAFTLDYQAATRDSIEAGMFFSQLTDTPPVPLAPSGIACRWG
jgi:hypothetical protein